MPKPAVRNRTILSVMVTAAVFAILVFGVLFDSRRHQTSIAPGLEPYPAPVERSFTDVRPPAVAGGFYPAAAAEIRKVVDDFLTEVRLPEITGRPKVVLAPHAGYVYSGRVAAHAFKSLAGSGYRRAVLLGSSHRHRFSGVAADGHDAWETPLGKVAVDRNFIETLCAASDLVRTDSDPHEQEHSLEVMVPFLIQVLGPQTEIVPLLFGSDDADAAEELALALAGLADDRTVIIISSDLSHYPQYEDANRFDGQTVESILTNDPDKFRSWLEDAAKMSGWWRPETLACAGTAIASGMILSQKLGLQPQLLKYANSGDYFPESKERVVGYAAVIFNGPVPEPSAGRELDEAEQREAVDIARRTLAGAFSGEAYSPQAESEIFDEKRGVFVTLRKHGSLRGCIGVFTPEDPLSVSIKSMALAAAFQDKRFRPLEEKELPELEIEVSVLSPMTRVADAGLIEIGKHGVYLRQGFKSGVFLPQVATEQNWDKETFLGELCRQKAGLDWNCWSDPRTELNIFTAQVFGQPSGL